MSDVAILPLESVARERRPAIGYAMALAAGTLFAINGTVSKVILESGLSSMRLTEVRCIGGLVGLFAIVLLTRPQALRIERRELLLVAAFGVFGVAFVQLFYFLAIHRLQIGVSLLIQYLGPLIVALFAHFALRERVRRRLWVALALALAGLTLVVDLWSGVSLDGLGVFFSICSAFTFAGYMLFAEKALGRRDPISLLCYGFLFATIPARVAEMCRIEPTIRKNGTIVPRTIIQAINAQIGRCVSERWPSSETFSPGTSNGKLHHGWAIAQNAVATRPLMTPPMKMKPARSAVPIVLSRPTTI